MKRGGPLQRKTPLKQGDAQLKRSPMPRGTSTLKTTKPLQGGSQLARASKPMAAVGARAKRTRQGKVAPTAAESAWMDAAAKFGCIVCWLQRRARVPAEIHHLKDGDRRRGHLFTIPLCVPHHRGGADDGPFISRHPWKKRFEAAYGAEDQLLVLAREVIKHETTG